MNGLKQSGNVSKTARRFSNISERIASVSGTVSNIWGRVSNKSGSLRHLRKHLQQARMCLREEESQILHIPVRKGGSQVHEKESCMSERVSNTSGGGGRSLSSGRVSNMTRCVSNMTGSVKREEGAEMHHESSQTRLKGSQSSREEHYICQWASVSVLNTSGRVLNISLRDSELGSMSTKSYV